MQNCDRYSKALFYSMIAYTFLLLAILDIGLWLYIALDDTNTFEQKKEKYLEYFPEIIANTTLLTIFCVLILLISVFFFNKSAGLIHAGAWKMVNKVLKGMACLLIFWQVFLL